MPLMHDWTEITVDESLLIPVVKELLALATDPNHVEVVYGTGGRVILAESNLAERWYQETLPKDEGDTEEAANETFDVATTKDQVTEVHASGFEVVAASSNNPIHGTDALVPLPVKRGPGSARKEVPPPLSNGEES
jgi:hypothetical protein